MRNVFVSLCLMALLPLCGCLGLGVQFRDQQGRALDWPRGDNAVVVELEFVQNYNGWVAISVNDQTAVEVPFGQTYTISKVSEKHFTYEVWWDEQVGYDGVLKKVRHHKTGLYTGPRVEIDEMFLRGVSMLQIVICNEGSEITSYETSQNHQFTLPPFGSTVLNAGAGDFRLTWRPAGNYSGESMRGCKILTVGKKVFWNGKFYEDRIYTNRSRPNWRDLRIMRSNGCFPL